LISALVFGGKPRAVTDWLIENGTTILSQEILTEVRRIIDAKFPYSLGDLARLEKLLERDAIIVKLGSVQVTICRDPDDNKVIETALAGKCQYIVTGDKDLLVLQAYEGVKILKPTELLQLVD
jgi:uncharacterized protein